MLVQQSRLKTQSILSEGHISNATIEQDSVSTCKLNRNNNDSINNKLQQKSKDKNDLKCEQATLRILLHSDRFISNEKVFFKFPKIDFYLNIDSLFSSINCNNTIEGSVITAINQYQKATFSEISKKSKGIHIYTQKRLINEMPWQCMVERMQTFGNSELNDISQEISTFCVQDFIEADLPGFASASSLNTKQEEEEESCTLQTASKIFKQYSQKEVNEKIDEMFIQNKDKPAIIYHGRNKQLVSVHLNECLLNLIQYTAEEFQMEVALSGIPEFVSSYNYNAWVKQTMRLLTNLFLKKSSTDYSSNQIFKSQKELLTQFGQSVIFDFESYEYSIGIDDFIIEMGAEDVKPVKKQNKKSQQNATSQLSQLISKDHDLVEDCQKMKGHSFKNYELKRKLTNEEKFFINNHYYKIQDFDFNQSKVCKYRILQDSMKNKIQLHA